EQEQEQEHKKQETRTTNDKQQANNKNNNNATIAAATDKQQQNKQTNNNNNKKSGTSSKAVKAKAMHNFPADEHKQTRAAESKRFRAMDNARCIPPFHSVHSSIHSSTQKEAEDQQNIGCNSPDAERNPRAR